jgi:hypothetical protein
VTVIFPKEGPMSEIDRVISLSTGHVTQEDMERIDDHCTTPAAPLVCAADPYGGWLYAPDSEIYIKNIEDDGYSDSMVKVIRYARKKGCKYVRLDRDVPLEETEDLNVHEW